MNTSTRRRPPASNLVDDHHNRHRRAFLSRQNPPSPATSSSDPAQPRRFTTIHPILPNPRINHLPTAIKRHSTPHSINPLMNTLKPQSNGPLYSNTVIGTLVDDGCTGCYIWYSEEGPGLGRLWPLHFKGLTHVIGPFSRALRCAAFRCFSFSWLIYIHLYSSKYDRKN